MAVTQAAVTQEAESMNDAAFRGVRLGSTLLIRPPDERADAAFDLVGALAPDPERQTVAGAPPSERESRGFWNTLLGVLNGCGPVRLAVSGAGTGGDQSPARWLSDRLGTEIVAPDGPLLPVVGAMAFVAGRTGRWVSFRPGCPPRPLGARFPAPAWERGLPDLAPETAEPIPAGLWLHGRGTAEGDPQLRRPVFELPVSAEVLIVVLGSPDASRLPVEEFLALRRALPAQATPPMWLIPYGGRHGDAVGQALADRLDERVVTTIGVPTGQPGVTSARDAAGRRTWDPFATEVGYAPRRGGRTPAPAILAHRPPIPGLAESGGRPGVYELDDGVYVEVVQSGLWLRGPLEWFGAVVRALPADPGYLRLTVGIPGEPVSDTLLAAVSGLAARLTPRSRCFLRLMVQDAPARRRLDHPAAAAFEPKAPARLAAPEPEAVADQDAGTPPSADAPEPEVPPFLLSGREVPARPRPQFVARTVVRGRRPPKPVSTAGDSSYHAAKPAASIVPPATPEAWPTRPTRPTMSRLEPEPVPTGPDEPAPGPDPDLPDTVRTTVAGPRAAATSIDDVSVGEVSGAFSGVDPQGRSTIEEQTWLRGHLGGRYDRYASTAVRLIAGQPALRAMAGAPGAAVVADLVALCDFLGDGRAALDEAAARGGADAMLPYVHCVVSGLGRLASYRGAAFCGGRLDDGAGLVRPGSVLTDQGVRQAVTSADCVLPGPTEFVIWSATARRLTALEPDRRIRRVAFLPGSRFRVLDAGDPAAAVRRVLLRQVFEDTPRDGLDADDLAVRDRLAAVAALRDGAAEAEAERLPAPDAVALTWHVTAS
jgi:hypothetical protein